MAVIFQSSSVFTNLVKDSKGLTPLHIHRPFSQGESDGGMELRKEPFYERGWNEPVCDDLTAGSSEANCLKKASSSVG